MTPPTAPAPLPCLLLRGLTRSAAHWGDFLDELTRQLPGAPLLTPEIPGNGSLNALTSPSRVAGLTDAVRAQWLQQGGQAPVQLVALSLGGMIACDWAQRYPQDVAGVVLINTSLRPFSPFYRRLRPARWWPLLRRLLLGASDLEWEHQLLDITSQQAAREPLRAWATVAQWVQLRAQHPVSSANAVRQLAAAARYHAPPRPPPVPMTVLVGAGDSLVHPSCSLRLAQAWGLSCHVHPQAGHDLPLDDGPWVARQIALQRQTLANCAQGHSEPGRIN